MKNFGFRSRWLLGAGCRLVSALILFSFSIVSAQGFIKNVGQIQDQFGKPNTEVLALLPGNGLNVQLRANGFSYECWEVSGLPNSVSSNNRKLNTQELLKVKKSISRVDIDFVNRNSFIHIEYSNKLETYLNYYNQLGEFSNVPVFTKIIYREVFPKTDIEFLATGEHGDSFKYNIILRPGADISKVKFLINGANELYKSGNSALKFITPNGMVTENIPNSYYLENQSHLVPIHYSLVNNVLNFTGSFNSTQTLIIDPASNRIWGTYYGDGGTEYGMDVTTDATNNSYITGYTLSNSNIATTGTYQSTIGGSFDAFLVKFTPAGVRLWGTYYGGSSVEASYAIAISLSGAIYISGDTFSTNGVASVGAHQTTYGGGIDDAFLARFDAAGQRIWSTYYGGILHDISYTLTTDNNNDIVLGGHTESPNAIASVGSFADTYIGGFDVFLVKFDPTGNRVWGTYFGDVNDEEAWAVACDGLNNIYCTGFTTSTTNISTVGTYQQNLDGPTDAYVSKFSANGNNLIWSTYYGGSQTESGSAIYIFPGGEVIVGGNTTSSNGIASLGAYQMVAGSSDDAFLLHLNQTGNRIWGTFFGGNDADYIEGIQKSITGNILFGGSTLSSNQIATPNAYQSQLNNTNVYDAYFAMFDLGGNRLAASYYGGTSNDNCYGMSTDLLGHIYLIGHTTSTDSIASPGAHLTSFAGGQDIFLAKFCMLPKPSITPAGITSICFGDSLILNTITSSVYSYLWSNGDVNDSILIRDTTSVGTYYFSVSIADGLGCVAYSDTSTVVIDYCTSLISETFCEVQLYPNPADQFIYLLFCDERERKIVLYSVTGEKLAESSSKEKNTSFFLPFLATGVYTLKVEEKGKNYFRKIVIR